MTVKEPVEVSHDITSLWFIGLLWLRSFKKHFPPIYDSKKYFPPFLTFCEYENFINVMETLLMQVSRYARDNYAFETAECCEIPVWQCTLKKYALFGPTHFIERFP